MLWIILGACALDIAATVLEIAAGIMQSNQVRNAVKDPSSLSDCYEAKDFVIFSLPLLLAGFCGGLAHLIAHFYGQIWIYEKRLSLSNKRNIYAILFATITWSAFLVGWSMIGKGLVEVGSDKEVRYSNGHCAIAHLSNIVIAAFAWPLHAFFVFLAYYTFHDDP
ncbi:unnamed protein product [Cuscuta epithymum]|uniref:Uncharacterized protein n=1 Tax=Cuscuta epithymum TaxID=186058 RepID=A0AAV0FQU6_9ASTE|nr:unnamed protein product [Cuscuta epithymum]CAH9138029.1 unnamed protein product [Cuscuta epithymum]